MVLESPEVVLEVLVRRSLGLKHLPLEVLEVLARKSPEVFEVVKAVKVQGLHD